MIAWSKNESGCLAHTFNLVVASQFDVFQATPVAQGVVRDVEHVVRFMVGKVNLQHMQLFVDGVDQPALSGEFVNQSDPAAADRPGAVGQFVLDVAGGKHRLAEAARGDCVKASFDTLLACFDHFS